MARLPDPQNIQGHRVTYSSEKKGTTIRIEIKEGEGQMTELKKCPFCGGEASIYHGDSTDGYIKGTDYVLAFCGWCGASIREKKEDDVIKKWNTRPNPWHTGTPSEGGTFLVCLKDGTYDIYEFGKEYKAWDIGFSDVVAWQKIEENEDGRTD